MSNNAGGQGWVNYFDITANVAITITALDVNCYTSGASGTIGVYMTPVSGTYVGNELNPSAWSPMTVARSQTFTAAARDTPSSAPLASPLVVPPGTYGVAIIYNGVDPAYTNGNYTYSNGDLSISTGSSTSQLFGGSLFTPRSWNGTIHYSVSSGFATMTEFGSGCGAGDPASLYESFDATNNPFDLSNTGFQMISTGATYIALPTTATFSAPTMNASLLGFSDDQTQQITLPWSIPSAAGMTSDVWVCSNGFISFVATSSASFSESVNAMLNDFPRLCPIWDDFNPATAPSGGGIYTEHDMVANKFYITWYQLPEFGQSTTNDFQVAFDSLGNIEVLYGQLAAADGLVGFSPGGGARDWGSTDLSVVLDPTGSGSITLGNDRPPIGLRGTARPVLGGTATIETFDIPSGSTAGAVLLGTSQFSAGVDLSSIGMPGCFLYTGGEIGSVGFNPAGPTQSQSFPMGNDPTFVGQSFHLQSVAIAVGINPLNLVSSNGLTWTIDVN